MTTNFFKVHRLMPLWDFVNGILDSGQDSAPVIDENDHLIGMVGIHDLYQKIVPNYVQMDEKLMEVMHDGYFEERMARNEHLCAQDLMVKNPDKVRPEDTIILAVALFVKHRRRVLPVVDEKNVLVGLISRKSVLRRLKQKTSQ